MLRRRMEPTSTVRRRRVTFSEQMVSNPWERARTPGHTMVTILLIAGLAVLLVSLLLMTSPEWAARADSLVLSLVGRAWFSRVTVAVSMLAGGFLVVCFFVVGRSAIPMFRRIWRQLQDPAYSTVLEIHVRGARFMASADPSDPRPWVLVGIAPGVVLYHSPWTPGEVHPPSPRDGFSHGKFPSEFRLIVHVGYRSILRLEAVGPLVDAIGSVRMESAPPLPGRSVDRQPEERWALYRGELALPSALVRIEGDALAAFETALAPAT